MPVKSLSQFNQAKVSLHTATPSVCLRNAADHFKFTIGVVALVFLKAF